MILRIATMETQQRHWLLIKGERPFAAATRQAFGVDSAAQRTDIETAVGTNLHPGQLST